LVNFSKIALFVLPAFIVAQVLSVSFSVNYTSMETEEKRRK
jgi:hypothetical protein